jgi:hypothetical protein
LNLTFDLAKHTSSCTGTDPRAFVAHADDIFRGGQPSEQDLLCRRQFASDADPILSYVRWTAGEDDDLSERGPAGLQRYRALRSEMERANALSDVRTCELCLSEGIPHTEVVCIHALTGQTQPLAPDKLAEAQISTYKRLQAIFGPICAQDRS